MSRLAVLGIAAGLALAAADCTPPPVVSAPPPSRPAPSVEAHASELAQRFVIVDGHIDVPYRLTQEPDAALDGSDNPAGDTLGDFSFRRARLGGLDAPFMSIYISAALQDTAGAAFAHANRLIDAVEAWTRRHPNRFEIARSPADVERIAAAGRVALPMGMENGAPIGSLDDLRHFFRRGIRYVSLTHGKTNALGDASYDSVRTWRGLSPLGRDVVREMNRLGILLDLSHVSDDAAFEILRLSRAPVIASHSSMQHFTPGWERNVSDSLARAIARNGGVVMINFGSSFLKTAYQGQQTQFQLRLNAALRQQGLSPKDAAAYPVYYAMRRLYPVGTVPDVADHIDYAVRLMGVDHVGLGSDFDGVTSLPAGLTDVSMYPNLIAELIRRGYTDADIEKICGGNALRVWREVERVATGG